MKLLFITLLAIVATAKSLKCEPNSVFKIDCNTCRCSSDGDDAVCTRMACNPDRVYISDGTLENKVSEESSDEESKQVCEPGTTFKDYCNTCKCSADGKSSVCTYMACDPEEWNQNGSRKTRSIEVPKTEEHSITCKPYTAFKYYCNTCTCTGDGHIGACTLMYCDPALWNIDGTMKPVKPDEAKQYCEPGTIFKDYCNSCKCSRDGKTAVCTLMACDPTEWNKDGTRKISPNLIGSDESEN